MAVEEKNEKASLSSDSFPYLHPEDSLVVAIVSPVLDPNNYHSWSRYVLTALSAKNKLQFVDGSTIEPEKTDPMYGAWKRCNNMVVSWIVHSVFHKLDKAFYG